jgi:hypothetical protein
MLHSSNFDLTTALQSQSNRGLIFAIAVRVEMMHDVRIGVEHDDILDALAQVKLRPQLQIFLFVSAADDFNHGFGIDATWKNRAAPALNRVPAAVLDSIDPNRDR